ncbi:hypothetical protein MD484_g1211, partial [Candolleomyces efflorescens]
MYKVQQEMLQDNPFLPPKDGTCIINTLPIELLAHIFRVGVEMQREGDGDDEFSEVEEEEERKALEAEFQRLRDDDTDSSDDEHKAAEDLPIEDDDDDPDWEDADEDGDGSEASDEDDEEEDEDMTEDESEEEEEEEDTPFEVLVSHVCKHWRETAINTPDLWTAIYMNREHQWDRYELYLERAKGQALDLDVNIDNPDAKKDLDSDDEDNIGRVNETEEHILEVKHVLDLIVPKASQWRSLVISTTTWQDSRRFLERFHEIPAAPTLERFEFRLYDDELLDEHDVFEPSDLKEPFFLPFHGNAPNLQFVNLWSIHIDWDGAMNMFKNLTELELGYHAMEVRPSWRAYSSFIKNSPQLVRLELKGSGPKLSDPFSLLQAPVTPATGMPSAYYTAVPTLGEDAQEGDPNEWPRYPLEVPSVHDLIVSDHSPEYAYALATKLHFPNLRLLSVDYPNEDYSRVAEAYSQPLRGVTSRRSAFQTIEALHLVNMGHLRSDVVKSMVHALNGLRHLTLQVEETFEAPAKVWYELQENAKAVYHSVRAKRGKEPQHKSPTFSSAGPSAGEGSSSIASSTQPGPSLTIVPPEPHISVPGPPASADSTGAAAAASDALSTITPQLIFPNLEGLRTRYIPTIHIRRFLKRRIKVGAPIRQLQMHERDNVTKDDQRWLSDHLEEFDFYSDSEEDDDESIDLSDDDMVDTDEEAEWTDEDDGDDHDDEDDWEDDDEDEDGDDDDDDDAGGGDEDEGRVRTRRGPTVSGVRGGAASTHVTTGLANLD